MIEARRVSAFDLVGYLLYVFAVGNIWYELSIYTLEYSSTTLVSVVNTGMLISQKSDIFSVIAINFSLAVFVLVVYCRNYVVMYSIDINPGDEHDRFSFFRKNYGFTDALERILRILIVFTVIVSSSNSLPIFNITITTIQGWVFSIFEDFSKIDQLAQIFTYYAIVLVILFMLFIIYDITVVYSTFRRNKGLWKEIDSGMGSDQQIDSYMRNHPELDAMLSYLNYYSTLKNGVPHYRRIIREKIHEWPRENRFLKIYLESYKFFERLFGILVSVCGIIGVIVGYNLIIFCITLVSIFLYVFFLAKNKDFLKTFMSVVLLKPLRDYILTIRMKADSNLKRYTIKEAIMKNAMKIIFSVSFLLLVGVALYTSQENSTSQLPESGKLVVWQTESDKNAINILSELEIEFQKLYPHIDLQIETIGWGDLSSRLGVALRKNEFPDVSHIQPFMTYSLVSKDLLSPITDLVKQLDAERGGIFPAVRDLQLIDGEYYGIAYAVGATFWLTKKEALESMSPKKNIETWDDYLLMLKQAKHQNQNFLVTLPGASPFFINQLYGELLANAGGRFFNPETLEPELDDKPSLAVLEFFRDLSDTGALDPSWSTTSYTAQFQKIADGVVHNTPVTYARASRTIEARAIQNDRYPVEPKFYHWLIQPVPDYRSSENHIATIDAEPYVIFNAASRRKYADGTDNDMLAREYLKLFYSKNFYSKFTQAVPIHLTPIFRDMASSQEYTRAVGQWSDWHIRTMSLLSEPGKTRPIMMPDTSDAAKKIPFLLEFEASQILSTAVAKAINDKDTSIYEIATNAQDTAREWVNAMKR